MKNTLKVGDVIYIPNNPLHNDHQILAEDWTPKKILGIKFKRRKPELRVLNFSRLHPSKNLPAIPDINERLEYIAKAGTICPIGTIKLENRTYIKFEKK